MKSILKKYPVYGFGHILLEKWKQFIPREKKKKKILKLEVENGDKVNWKEKFNRYCKSKVGQS